MTLLVPLLRVGLGRLALSWSSRSTKKLKTPVVHVYGKALWCSPNQNLSKTLNDRTPIDNGRSMRKCERELCAHSRQSDQRIASRIPAIEAMK
jgi:hypothetical protein